MLAFATQPAHAGVHVGIGIGVGGGYYAPGPYYGYPYSGYYGPYPGYGVYFGPGYYPWYNGRWGGGYYRGYHGYYGHGGGYYGSRLSTATAIGNNSRGASCVSGNGSRRFFKGLHDSLVVDEACFADVDGSA